MSRIGVCSWSLQPESPAELAQRVRETGLAWVQLALGPLRGGGWDPEATRSALADAGVGVLSGMMSTRGEDYSTLATIRTTGGLRPDMYWESNLEGAQEDARTARALGLELVTFHAGFLPERAGDERSKLLDRLRQVARVFAAEGVRLGLETGQESAETLLAVLEELDAPTVGVNFDPANMLLYGMGDPVEALERLAHRVLQVHVKDALPTRMPGTWGSEVRAGAGAVDWGRFFDVLRAHALDVDLVIEREAGAQRVDDVRAARALVERELARTGSGS